MAKRKGEKGEAAAAKPQPADQPRESAQPPGPNTFAAVFGEVVSLLTVPASHKHLFLTDLEWLVIPPLMLRQFRLWRQDDRPVGFASWAFLTEDAEARVLAGVRRLKPGDWKGGDRAWLMDVVAPNPDSAKQMIDELKRTVFPDRPLKAMQQQADGKPVVVEF